MRSVLLPLMYKHLIVRMRRFIQTPIELISPIFYFLIIFILKHFLVPALKSDSLRYQALSIQNTEPFSLDAVPLPYRIYYYPGNDLTKQLMNKVNEKFHSSNLLPYAKEPGLHVLANNESAVQELQGSITDMDAILIFQNVIDKWPEKLVYTIRQKVDFFVKETEEEQIGPHERYGTIYEPFARLQWAVDTSYIELVSGHDVTMNVTLQEFPYVKREEEDGSGMISNMVMYLCQLALLLVFVFTMVRLVEERLTGIQELIKMVGVPGYLLSISHFLNVLPSGLIYAVVSPLLLTTTSSPLLPHINPLLLAIMLFLHFCSIMSLAYLSSYMLNTGQYATSLSSIAFMLILVPARALDQRKMNKLLRVLTGLLPHIPLTWFCEESAMLEQFGRGVTFGTMFESHSKYAMPVFVSYIMFVVQTALYCAVAWYLSCVNPGPYGQPLPLHFMCQKRYWSKTDVAPDDEDMELQDIEHETSPMFFEATPKGQEVGIKIINVSKVYPQHRALKNVSLDVFKGQITVLLGHNGAGKTTLMSIICGMLKPTVGKVYVEGIDTTTHKDELRQHLGLCPQHNLFFPDLTVLQHILFFTMLKGTSYDAAKSSSHELLDSLGLYEKRNMMSSNLSGGMKRRLQLACALAGDARVLVLDEPTSGLDVQTRRQLWDLLSGLRGKRTVLLSTHFMEEAEALGDRVVALHAGTVRCHATTMQLKRAIGSGFRLSFTTTGLPDEPAITQAVQSVLSEATIKESSPNSISYNLPARCSDRFPQLFTLVENRRAQLGIESIGVGKSNLEDVFVKLCSDVTTNFFEDEIDNQAQEPVYEKISGPRLYMRQLYVLLARQIKFLWFKKISFALLQVILPICMLTLFSYMLVRSVEPQPFPEAYDMNLNLFDDVKSAKVFVDVGEGYNLRSVSDRYPQVEFRRTDNATANILRIGHEDLLEYNKYLLGVELNDTYARVTFTTRIRHALPVALNMLTNVVASRALAGPDGPDGATIHTYNHPLKDNSTRRTSSVDAKPSIIIQIWICFMVWTMYITVGNAVVLCCMERLTGARHLHLMAGCSPPVYWAATLLSHVLLYTVLLIVPIIILPVILDGEQTINQPDFLCALYITLSVGLVAFLCLSYLLSCFMGERAANITLVISVLLFGLVTPLYHTQGAAALPPPGWLRGSLAAVQLLLPPHALTRAASRAGAAARDNALCALNRHLCPALHVPEPGFDSAKCCASSDSYRSYYSMDESSPVPLWLIMTFQALFYMSFVILIEYGLFNSVLDRVCNSRYTPRPPPDADELVAAERAYVDQAVVRPPQRMKDAMLVSNLHKRYKCIKEFVAVNGLNFSLKKGECFGLLGVNGAGKSTTFKMLVAEQCATRGQIYGNGYQANKLSTKYLQSLGYCPQFFGLDTFLTGSDNIKMMLTLRGLTSADVRTERDFWIEVVGLEQYARRAVSGYSGGCARRLSTAAALCGGAPVTLLDEPTAGVDVAARRRVWAAIRRALRTKRSIIVTSHSMDEMEALCNRIAIMSKGVIRALGEAAVLRARHAAGHSLLLQLGATDVPQNVSQLKRAVEEKFDCTLKDEHKRVLHYHINRTMRYSELFTELERLKSQFPGVLEDYSVTETTLEEVFLSIAEEGIEGPSPV